MGLRALTRCTVHSTFCATALNPTKCVRSNVKSLKSSSGDAACVSALSVGVWLSGREPVVPAGVCVSESDHGRARAVSAHSTCGLVRFDRTWLSSKGSSPAGKQTDARSTDAQNRTSRRRRLNTCNSSHTKRFDLFHLLHRNCHIMSVYSDIAGMIRNLENTHFVTLTLFTGDVRD